MKQKILYFIWLCLYIACVGLGTITERSTAGHILLGILGTTFFVPGVILLYDGMKGGDKKLLRQVRFISLGSLVLTMLLIVLNIVFVAASEAVGEFLNGMLILVRAPGDCFYWLGISMFLWACLFVGSFPRMWKK